VPLLQPEKCSSHDFESILKQFDADLFVVVAYGEIIKRYILDIPRHGCINVHASLLPKYRGASPIRHALKNGEKESGVAVIQLVEKMDAGDVLKEKGVAIDENMQFDALESALIKAGIEALLEVLQDFQNGTVHPISQNEDEVTFAPKLQKEELLIDWNMPAEEIHNLVRAMAPTPGAYSFVEDKGIKKRVKILESRLSKEPFQASPGTLFQKEKKALYITTGSTPLEVILLQPEGKRVMSAKEFLNSRSIKDLEIV